MKPGLKSFLRAVLIGVVPVALFVGYIEFRMYRLQHLDHARILSACREAIENRASYRNDKDRWPTLHQEDVLLLQPLPANVPKAIRDLHPRDVVIRPDYVMINWFIPFYRIGLLGFRSGAKQFGTFEYIDGLWFWNGNRSTEKKPMP